MKTLIFKNGNAVDFIECYSNNEYVQNMLRDVLDFRFNPSEHTLDSIDALFSSDECSKLIIRETTIMQVAQVGEDGNIVVDEAGNPIMQDVQNVEDFVYENYSMRVSLSKQIYTLTTENGVEDVEQISVKMTTITDTEKQLMAAKVQLANAVTEEELHNAYTEGVNSI